jgi:hypothetical protein
LIARATGGKRDIRDENIRLLERRPMARLFTQRPN